MIIRNITQLNFRDMKGNPILENNQPKIPITFNENSDCSWKGKDWWDDVKQSGDWNERELNVESKLSINGGLFEIDGLMDVIYTQYETVEVTPRIKYAEYKLPLFGSDLITLVIDHKNKKGTVTTTLDNETGIFNPLLNMVLSHSLNGIDVLEAHYIQSIEESIETIMIQASCFKEPAEEAEEDVFRNIISQVLGCKESEIDSVLEEVVEAPIRILKQLQEQALRNMRD